ncbi:MAG: hypothetical protein EBQ92_03870, partial [Proteobacteria bacterium]|nr:hypothetical protein [Pseudomonadota bacterium]
MNIEFERIENLVVYTGPVVPKFSQLAFGSSGILIDYVYLDSEERRRFAQVGHEYLIEQVQYNEANLSGTSTTSSETTQTFTLNFNHPCKEIIWAHRLGVFNGTAESTFLGYTAKKTQDAWDEELTEVAKRIVRSSIKCPGETSAETDETDLNLIDFDDNTKETEVATYRLTNDAKTVLQFNKVINVEDGGAGEVYAAYGDEVIGLTGSLTVVLTALYKNLDSLLDRITRATVDVIYTGADITDVKVVDVTHNLTMEDISMPVSQYGDQRVSGTTDDDVHVVQLNNYGVRLDGKGNIVTKGNLVLNGHDRFNIREGGYFNYVQPKAHHTATPADGINVYS